MDGNLIFATSTASTPLSLGGSDPSTVIGARMNDSMTGQEFAGVMKDLMANVNRQGFAAAGTGVASGSAALGLQTFSLGTEISLITTASPLPDAGSLAEFARSQGLGEGAVKALFGDLMDTTPIDTATQNALSNFAWPGSEAQSGDVNSLIQMDSFASSSNLNGTTGLLPSATTLQWLAAHPSEQVTKLEAPQIKSSWENAPKNTLDLKISNVAAPSAVLMSQLTSSTLAQSIDSTPQVTSATGSKMASANSENLSASEASLLEGQSDSSMPDALNQLLQVGQVSGSFQFTSSGNSTSQPTDPGLSSVQNSQNASNLLSTVSQIEQRFLQKMPSDVAVASIAFSQIIPEAIKNIDSVGPIETSIDSPVEMGPLDVMRLRMVPAWETMTRQLAKLNGQDAPTTWANLSAASIQTKSADSAIPEAVINLGNTDIGLDLQKDLDLALSSATFESTTALPSNVTPENSKSTTGLTIATAPNGSGLPPMEDRGAQIQLLAEKLGQAMSDRLQEQIEKGQWRLHLKLNPGHLGSIDVELDMHQGGLDALFKTENTLTRELITQGMAKLREGLAQSGMAVASVWVNSDSQREPGGNSTPRQQTFNERIDSNTSQEVSNTQSVVSHKELRSADGWDTLA